MELYVVKLNLNFKSKLLPVSLYCTAKCSLRCLVHFTFYLVLFELKKWTLHTTTDVVSFMNSLLFFPYVLLFLH